MKKIEAKKLLAKLPQLEEDTNKYSLGHVVVIGGNTGLAGAARLAAEAALRSGAGLVSVLTHKDNIDAILCGRPELMVRSFEGGDDVIVRADCLIIGPGLGRDEWAHNVWEKTKDLATKKVVDADALWWLAQSPQKLINAIITPHEGEACHLLKIQKITNRSQSVIQLLEFCETAVLKGHETLIAQSQGEIYMNTSGNPILAMAGSGDILTGVIGSFLAQGLRPDEAACLGSYIHGTAGDLLAHKPQGTRGSVASDLLPFIRELV